MTVAEAVELQHQLRKKLVEELEVIDQDNVPAVTPRSRLADDMTLGEYAAEWFVHLEKSGRRRPHVIDTAIHKVESLILPLLGDLHLSQIGKPELATWMTRIPLVKSAHGRPYAKATLRSAWGILRCMLNDAELVVGVPCYAAANMRFRVNAKSTQPKDTLTRDELGRLLQATESESCDVRAMIWLSATTGMRFGEVSALTWDDIDFDKGVVHVRRSQVEGKVYPTKTSTERSVPLFAGVAVLLQDHREWLEHQRFKRDDGLVFPSRAGTYRTSSLLRKPLRRCAAKAGIDKRVTNQALRRTVNNLIRQTAGEIAARAITGHATQAMTEHYSDVTLQEKTQAGEAAFAGILGSPKAPSAATPKHQWGERWGELDESDLDENSSPLATREGPTKNPRRRRGLPGAPSRT